MNHPEKENAITVYTIGHSNTPASTMIGLLERQGIQVLVDVRSAPYSRFSPQFNKEAITKSLRAQGIEYVYAGDQLGGRPKDPACYVGGELPQEKAIIANLVDYAAVMQKDFFQKGIIRLLEIARERKAAVMCSERDPAKCHRHHLIGRYLAGQGVEVLHILGDGSLISEADLGGAAEQLKIRL
jgi:uncharacterized protein (DUF488 family)